MYRYSVDNTVTYTSGDFVLFRESPFACWMERLTLENPDHGIPPDLGSEAPAPTGSSQQELAATLQAEGRDVVLVPWDSDEPSRRSATLAAMRRGADFIIDGQLALGPLSDSAKLLMRTSGFSDLGNYLYMPCDTSAHTDLESAFRLCFLADLLHGLQGQLPPQMLIIRGSGDLLPLETDDHIYHYRAVKQRFMGAMREFRKHRMPDPAESFHFGRWSECANEVLRQRALREPEVEEGMEQEQGIEQEQPLPLVANAEAAASPAEPQAQAGGLAMEGTLAEQARQLSPDSYTTERRPPPYSHGHGAAPLVSTTSPSALDAALENLEFIGSSDYSRPVGEPAAPAPIPEPELALQPTPAPAPALRPRVLEEPAAVAPPEPQPVPSAQPPPAATLASSEAGRKPHPLDCTDAELVLDPLVDRDDASWPNKAVSPAPTLQTDNREFDVDCYDDSDYRQSGRARPEIAPQGVAEAGRELPKAAAAGQAPQRPEPEALLANPRPFNNSLITSGELED